MFKFSLKKNINNPAKCICNQHTIPYMAIVHNPTKGRQLQIEPAITVDIANVFVNATYNLEGDSPLAKLQCIIPILLLFAKEKNQ